ncbi:transmembrane protein C16orf54 homolog [Heterocephalus glaber]|uniref:Transmembrane protein C16orf54 homolog n=1 Tax=Heterocephalus glaber TaxID=10181 RepID=A0AAX6R9T7_HETGA|nr:transmembrane protein C16orf54 homolog [Heterocephalus glaber]XP_021093113.1 transmembrane protein C16orf54 homolog [Heterocephalus glaber]
MPSPPAQLGSPEEAASWPPPPCGPCIPILLGLAALAALLMLSTAALAERLLRRAARPDPGPGCRAPALEWRPGGELWIAAAGSAREPSECWFGCEEPLLAGAPPWDGAPPPGRPSCAGPDAAARPGSPEPDWGLQPRVTREQLSAFWRREARPSGAPEPPWRTPWPGPAAPLSPGRGPRLAA